MSRVVVYHSSYGCDTGCCGHTVEMDGAREQFFFSHAWDDDPLLFAKELVESAFGAEHVADLDWENSFVVADD